MIIGAWHHQEAKVQVNQKEENLILKRSPKAIVKTEADLVALADPATPVRETDQKTEKADQEITNLNNMEDILQEDKHKSFHLALNYLLQILIQKYVC